MGHRQDENCNIDRRALIMEKANRLGECRTLRKGDDLSPLTSANKTSIEAQLKKELMRRNHEAAK